jgi:hypothetical protein
MSRRGEGRVQLDILLYVDEQRRSTMIRIVTPESFSCRKSFETLRDTIWCNVQLLRARGKYDNSGFT